MTLVNRVYDSHHKSLLIVLYLMFYSYNYNDTKEKSYAVAINVPMNLCQGNFDPSNELFSTLKMNAVDVRNAIYNTTNQFYEGEYLMAVGPSPCDCIKSNNCKKTDICTLIENCTSRCLSCSIMTHPRPLKASYKDEMTAVLLSTPSTLHV